MLELYQFPISHYCEKVRWALQYKGLPYRTINLLPGLHLLRTQGLAPASSVPILRHGKTTIQGSAAIISYLDGQFPENSLTPQDSSQQKSARHWEQFADETLGPHVRLICYEVLLKHPRVVIPFFAYQGPWYGRLYLRAIFPKLASTMRKVMRINAENAVQSRITLEKALDTLETQLSRSPFLTGYTFTRADLATAALLAPLIQPEQYGLPWPDAFPEALSSYTESLRPRLQFVADWYAANRLPD